MKSGYTLIAMLCLIVTMQACMSMKTDYSPESREIIIAYPDSTIRARILLHVDEKMKIDKDLKYYWYYTDRVRCNTGGFSGKPLHDDYTVFTINNELICKGYFSNGLKHGVWKRWYTNGNLKSIENWKNGIIEGKAYYYGLDGQLVRISKYKNNLLHGKTIILRKTSSETIMYHKGSRIEKIPKEKNPKDKNDNENKEKADNKEIKKQEKEKRKEDKKKDKELKNKQKEMEKEKEKKEIKEEEDKNQDESKKDGQEKEISKSDEDG